MPKLRRLAVPALVALFALPVAPAQAHKINLDAAADKVADAAAKKHRGGRSFKARCSRRIASDELHSHRVRCTFSWTEGSRRDGSKCKGKGTAKYRSEASRKLKIALDKDIGCVSLNPPGTD